MTEPSDPVQALMRCIEPFHDAFRPLLGSEEGSAGKRLEGTITLVADRDERYAITAHHAVQAATPHFIGVREAMFIPWPSKYSILVPAGAPMPDLDVAWAHTRLTSPAPELEGGFPLALAITAQEWAAQTAYVAVGFPASKGKVRMATGEAKAKLMCALVELREIPSLSGSNADKRTHLAFGYSQDARTDITGASAVGAKPKGMSGGAVLAIGSSRNLDGSITYVPFLVGILTEFHESEGVLIAARIRHLWEAVDRQAPALHAPLYRAVGA